MEKLDKYNGLIIDLYEQSKSIKYISEELYNICNMSLKNYNRFSGGALYVFIPRYTKTQCMRACI